MPVVRTMIARWGSDLALRLPESITADAGLREGTPVELSVQGCTIVIRSARPKYRLADLLTGVTEETRRDEVDWGDAAGKEVW